MVDGVRNGDVPLRDSIADRVLRTFFYHEKWVAIERMIVCTRRWVLTGWARVVVVVVVFRGRD